MQTWSVGILCYNEVDTIEQVALQLRDVLRKIANTYEILLVDDGSTDGSLEKIKALTKQYPDILLVDHIVNKGIGAGLLSVYQHARYENVSVFSGDGQFDCTEFLPFTEVKEGTFISFFRRENLHYSLFRNILSYLNRKVNNVFIGIDTKDVNWAKIYKKADLDQLDLQLKSSLVESEIFAKLIYHGRKMIEVESKYLPRTHGVSKGASSNIVKKAIADIRKLISVMNVYKKNNKKDKLPQYK